LQILPFASEETLTTLERNVTNCSSMTDMLHNGLTPQQITEKLFEVGPRPILPDLASILQSFPHATPHTPTPQFAAPIVERPG